MDDTLFNDLLGAVEEIGAHTRGEAETPPERVHFAGIPDARAIRKRMRLAQHEFAALLGVPLSTLRNWEQGRRAPQGSSLQLLRVADRHPDALRDLEAA